MDGASGRTVNRGGRLLSCLKCDPGPISGSKTFVYVSQCKQENRHILSKHVRLSVCNPLNVRGLEEM